MIPGFKEYTNSQSVNRTICIFLQFDPAKKLNSSHGYTNYRGFAFHGTNKQEAIPKEAYGTFNGDTSLRPYPVFHVVILLFKYYNWLFLP